jgi:P-type Cu+ transporter
MTTRTHTPAGTATTPATAPVRVELAVGGMTCASCAARVEKKLNRLDGVTASVNFATETAAVSYDPAAVSAADLVATVEATGYTARLPEPPAPEAAPGGAPPAAGDGDETAGLRQRLLLCVALTVPVVAMAMVPAL